MLKKVLLPLLLWPLMASSLETPRGEGRIEDSLIRNAVVKFQINQYGVGKSLCTGAFITDRTIVTAAHCLNFNLGILDTLDIAVVNDRTDQVIRYDSFSKRQFTTHIREKYLLIAALGYEATILSGEEDLGLIVLDEPYHRGPVTVLMPPVDNLSWRLSRERDLEYLIAGAGSRNFSRFTLFRTSKHRTYNENQGPLGASAEFDMLVEKMVMLKATSGFRICGGDSGGPVLVDFGASGHHQVGVVTMIPRNDDSGILALLSDPIANCAEEAFVTVLDDEKVNWIWSLAK